MAKRERGTGRIYQPRDPSDPTRQITPSFKHAIRGMPLGMRGRPRQAHGEASAAVRGLSDRYSRFFAAYIKYLAAWADVLAGENESAITLLEQVVAA
jgi:hypothetical protein